MKSLGEKLKEQRELAGESLQQVADATGVSKPHLWEIESARQTNPTIKVLKRLAGHFGVTASYLMGERPAPPIDELIFGRKLSTDLSEEDKRLVLRIAERLSASCE